MKELAFVLGLEGFDQQEFKGRACSEQSYRGKNAKLHSEKSEFGA